MGRHKIGIIGGSGYIGSALALRLVSSFDVKVLDVKELPKNLVNKAEFQRCDIRRYDEVQNELSDVELVMHAAIIQIPLLNKQKEKGYEVNFLGTQNVCKVVDENPRIKGMILAGSWHTMGERELEGIIDEEFGFRSDKVEDRARLYALSKIAQEAVVRFYDEMSGKIYGIIRMGTVLGECMPEKTAANIFIEKGLRGEAITPYKHSMYRPMLYVDVSDVCKAYEIYAKKILNDEIEKSGNSLTHIVNVYYPKPTTILELAGIVRDAIIEYSDGKIQPPIEIVDKGMPPLFNPEDKERLKVNIMKAKKLVGIEKFTSPKESIERILRSCFLLGSRVRGV